MVEPNPVGLENRQWSSRSLVGSNPTPAAVPIKFRMVAVEGTLEPSSQRSLDPPASVGVRCL